MTLAYSEHRLSHGMQALAAAGGNAIDIHHGDRDQKTCTALKALWTLKPFNEQEVKELYDAFVSYLRQQAKSKNTKNILEKTKGALQALGEKPIIFLWPRLNDSNQPINYRSDSFQGKELIARIYQFILDEPCKQKDNLMIGLIHALDDGKDVCHPGKAQRIAVAVLQGSEQLPEVQ